MKITVINGPNLNMLGYREQTHYGKMNYKQMCEYIQDNTNHVINFYQSNHEGEIIDYIHNLIIENEIDGLVINPGAYTHTSIAIMDALYMIKVFKVEVHLSDIDNREEFRKNSFTKNACDLSIIGMGIDGYLKAIEHIAMNKIQI
jgi:3-dehydroquinate dehydratase-2